LSLQRSPVQIRSSPQCCAEVAQLVEHGPEKAGVPSSNLGLGTISLVIPSSTKNAASDDCLLSCATMNTATAFSTPNAERPFSRYFHGLQHVFGLWKTLWRSAVKWPKIRPLLWISPATASRGPGRDRGAEAGIALLHVSSTDFSTGRMPLGVCVSEVIHSVARKAVLPIERGRDPRSTDGRSDVCPRSSALTCRSTTGRASSALFLPSLVDGRRSVALDPPTEAPIR
jgi:hypothetical protein